MSKSIIPIERIEQSILLIRGQRVMLDSDLAELYGVETKTLMRSVKRNIDRFPADFMFQMNKDEFEILKCHFGTSRFSQTKGQNLISQIAISNNPQVEAKNLKSQIVTSKNWGGRRKLPHVFTEQGVAMLSSVLRSKRAVAVNIEIMRAFVKLRRILESHKELAEKLEEMEKKYDTQFKIVFDAIRKMMAPVRPEDERKIGFKLDHEE